MNILISEEHGEHGDGSFGPFLSNLEPREPSLWKHTKKIRITNYDRTKELIFR